MSETCTHKPISLAYLGSSNRAHTVVLRGSSRARCERGLGWGEYRGVWAEPAWFSTACDPNRCMLKPTASLCAVHQNGILLASRLALRRAEGAKVLGDSVDFGLRRRREMHGGLTRHSRGGKSRNAGHHGLQRHGPSGQARAALEGCARREVVIIVGLPPSPLSLESSSSTNLSSGIHVAWTPRARFVRSIRQRSTA